MKRIILTLWLIILAGSVQAAGNRPRQLLEKMFSAVQQNMFAVGYDHKRMMDVTGSVAVTTPPVTVSKKLQQLATDLSFSFSFDGVVLPDHQCRLNISGELGELTFVRRGVQEILYSSDFNAYSQQQKGVQSRAVTFAGYFRDVLNRIRMDILESGRWNLSKGSDVVFGADPCYVVTAATHFDEAARRNARARVQKVDDLLTFWKRGTVTFYIRKADGMPVRIDYENPVQNIRSQIVLAYPAGSRKPIQLDVTGDSAGIAGSGQAAITYDTEGAIRSVTLRFDNQLGQSFSLDLSMDYRNEVQADAVAFMPPFGATRMARENLKLLVLTNVAGVLLRMQQAGINVKTLRF